MYKVITTGAQNVSIIILTFSNGFVGIATLSRKNYFQFRHQFICFSVWLWGKFDSLKCIEENTGTWWCLIDILYFYEFN